MPVTSSESLVQAVCKGLENLWYGKKIQTMLDCLVGIILTCSDAADCLVVCDPFEKSYKGLVLLAF